MVYKLRTSADTQKIFSKLSQTDGLQPYILSKLAIALSIKRGPLSDDTFKTDALGQELNRQTIFGDQELLFRTLIVCSEGRPLEDEEFFPRIVKAHLDRGAKLLEDESRYSRNLLYNLCQLEKNI